MRKDRYKKGHFHARSLTLVLAVSLSFVLLACGVVGGTLAWLTDKSDEVENVFTPSDINVTLTESKSTNPDDKDQNVNTNSYKMIPGFTIAKDPKATVVSGSEDCYVFVKVEKSANFDNYMTYAIAEGWTELTEAAGSNYKVYYMVFDSKSTAENKPVMGTPYSILSGNVVNVKDTVTKDMMNAIDGVVDVEDDPDTPDVDEAKNASDAEIALRPKLTFIAYASQLKNGNTTGDTNFDAITAWNNITTK